MQDKLNIIKKVIEAHQLIRGQIITVGGHVNDVEALFNLQKMQSQWSISLPEGLNVKQETLQQTFCALADAVDSHYGWEERVLPPILGELIMQALVLEHRESQKKLAVARSILTDTKLTGLSREDLLKHRSQVLNLVNDICQSVEGHVAREETVLHMARRALEAQG